MQNVKKYLIIFVAIAFAIAVVAACVTLFSVKKVSAEFSVYGDSQAEEIQKDLDLFKGKNMIFLKKSDVYGICDKYPYYEITSVEKEYPNVLKVSVGKRVETFTVAFGGKTYVLDGEGTVLNDVGETEFPQNVVPIELGDLNVVNGDLGKKIATSDDGLFYSVIKTARAAGIIDVVKDIDLRLFFNGESYEGNAIFHTYTGVEIRIENIEDDGENKIRAAFNKYETLSDYEKTTYKLIVTKNKTTGEIYADWSEDSVI